MTKIIVAMTIRSQQREEAKHRDARTVVAKEVRAAETAEKEKGESHTSI